jgi:putative ABC transport system ATP-binding protein
VAIARAFINAPKILFADEPTGNLDAESAQNIINLIFDLNAMSGATLMLVTHDRELSQRAGRVIVLKGGKLVADNGGAGSRAFLS